MSDPSIRYGAGPFSGGIAAASNGTLWIVLNPPSGTGSSTQVPVAPTFVSGTSEGSVQGAPSVTAVVPQNVQAGDLFIVAITMPANSNAFPPSPYITLSSDNNSHGTGVFQGVYAKVLTGPPPTNPYFDTIPITLGPGVAEAIVSTTTFRGVDTSNLAGIGSSSTVTSTSSDTNSLTNVAITTPSDESLVVEIWGTWGNFIGPDTFPHTVVNSVRGNGNYSVLTTQVQQFAGATSTVTANFAENLAMIVRTFALPSSTSGTLSNVAGQDTVLRRAVPPSYTFTDIPIQDLVDQAVDGDTEAVGGIFCDSSDNVIVPMRTSGGSGGSSPVETVSFRGGTEGSPTSPFLVPPPNIQDGDLLVFVSMVGLRTTADPPEDIGWTKIITNRGHWFALNPPLAPSGHIVYYKFASAEPTQYPNDVFGVLKAYRGVSQGGTVNAATISPVNEGIVPNMPDIVTTVPNCLVLRIYDWSFIPSGDFEVGLPGYRLDLFFGTSFEDDSLLVWDNLSGPDVSAAPAPIGGGSVLPTPSGDQGAPLITPYATGFGMGGGLASATSIAFTPASESVPIQVVSRPITGGAVVLGSDTFNRANSSTSLGTASSGLHWNVIGLGGNTPPARWGITGARAYYAQSPSGGASVAYLDPGAKANTGSGINFFVTAFLYNNDPSSINQDGLVAVLSPDGSGVYVTFRGPSEIDLYQAGPGGTSIGPVYTDSVPFISGASLGMFVFDDGGGNVDAIVVYNNNAVFGSGGGGVQLSTVANLGSPHTAGGLYSVAASGGDGTRWANFNMDAVRVGGTAALSESWWLLVSPDGSKIDRIAGSWPGGPLPLPTATNIADGALGNSLSADIGQGAAITLDGMTIYFIDSGDMVNGVVGNLLRTFSLSPVARNVPVRQRQRTDGLIGRSGPPRGTRLFPTSESRENSIRRGSGNTFS